MVSIERVEWGHDHEHLLVVNGMDIQSKELMLYRWALSAGFLSVCKD